MLCMMLRVWQMICSCIAIMLRPWNNRREALLLVGDVSRIGRCAPSDIIHSLCLRRMYTKLLIPIVHSAIQWLSWL